MSDNWREKIKAGMIAHRLLKHFEGEIELSNTQLKAADLLFKRIEPELTRTEISGKDGAPIETKQSISESDKEILTLHRQKIIDDYVKSTKGK